MRIFDPASGRETIEYESLPDGLSAELVQLITQLVNQLLLLRRAQLQRTQLQKLARFRLSRRRSYRRKAASHANRRAVCGERVEK